MALTDFLSDEAPGTSLVYSSKNVDWAAEMEDADIGTLQPFSLCKTFFEEKIEDTK